MARARVQLTVTVDRWVQPYLLLMSRMPGGPKATAAVVAFVREFGMRAEPRL